MSTPLNDATMDLASGIAAFESKHFGTAIQLLSPLAGDGHPEAQYRMAIMLQNGLGIVANTSLAFEYMESSAKQGIAFAQHGLGFMYMMGECVEKNGSKAIEWLSQASKQGMMGSATTLAQIYEEGTLVSQNLSKAAELYQLAGFPEEASRIESLK